MFWLLSSCYPGRVSVFLVLSVVMGLYVCFGSSQSGSGAVWELRSPIILPWQSPNFRISVRLTMTKVPVHISLSLSAALSWHCTPPAKLTLFSPLSCNHSIHFLPKPLFYFVRLGMSSFTCVCVFVSIPSPASFCVGPWFVVQLDLWTQKRGCWSWDVEEMLEQKRDGIH